MDAGLLIKEFAALIDVTEDTVINREVWAAGCFLKRSLLSSRVKASAGSLQQNRAQCGGNSH
jgi:hypothetical protein